jgi:molybdopterin converting factor small subunit
MTQTHITLKLFASLKRFTPPSADGYPITPGTTIREVLQRLGVPEADAKLIFINGVKGQLTSPLGGGERVGIFPPVGGG